MNPWDIIGWTIVVVFIALPVLTVVAAAVRKMAQAVQFRVRCRRSKNAELVEGQRWISKNGTELTISNLFDNGVIGVKTLGGASWGERPEEFRSRQHYLSYDPRSRTR